jgi:lipid II:glycine glycyltransferase (peptidoglycan interpeptide bridge formation enzyme)
VALARRDGRAVAGVVILLFGKRAVYKYGASDRTFQKLRPNNFILWAAIRRCRDLGLETLCLGRTDLHHRGLKQFKDGWGAKETRLVYLRYDFHAERFRGPAASGPGLSEKLFRRLPLPLLDLIGAWGYRHMG